MAGHSFAKETPLNDESEDFVLLNTRLTEILIVWRHHSIHMMSHLEGGRP